MSREHPGNITSSQAGLGRQLNTWSTQLLLSNPSSWWLWVWRRSQDIRRRGQLVAQMVWSSGFDILFQSMIPEMGGLLGSDTVYHRQHQITWGLFWNLRLGSDTAQWKHKHTHTHIHTHTHNCKPDHREHTREGNKRWMDGRGLGSP